MKNIFIILAIFILIAVCLVAAKDLILETILEKTVQAVSGLEFSIRSINMGVFKPTVRVSGMTLLNPKAFTDRVMFDIPELSVHYDLAALFRKEIYIKEMLLDLKYLSIIKNSDGVLNLSSLKVVELSSKGRPVVNEQVKRNAQKSKTKFRFDKLRLKIGTVIYKDYTHTPGPKIRTFVVNLDEQYENIQDPYILGSLVVAQALVRTNASQMAGFNLGSIQQNLESTVGSTTEQVLGVSKGIAQGATSTVEKTKEVLGGLLTLPAGSEEKR